MDATRLETVPDAGEVPHGWALHGNRLVVVASAAVDVDAMPRHMPYSYFGVHRDAMAPGPVRIAFALTVDPDGRLGVQRRWDAGGARLFRDAGEWSAWAFGTETNAAVGSSVAAPFTVPLAILAAAGLVAGKIENVMGTASLIGTAHGPAVADAYTLVAERAALALREVLGGARVERLARLAAMGWYPTPRETGVLHSDLPSGYLDSLLDAGASWPFLRRSLMGEAGLRAGPAPVRAPPEGGPTPLDLAVEALGPSGSRAHLRRLAPVGEHLAAGREGFLASLPVDWLPASGDDPAWRPLLRIAEHLATLPLAADLPGAAVMRDARGRWEPYERRLVSAALPGAADGTLQGVAAHLADMRMAFERMLLRPAVDHCGGEGPTRIRTRGVGAQRNMCRLILGQGGLLALAERAGRYHRRRETLRAELRALDPGLFEDLDWPVHLPRWQHPKTGLCVVPLADEAELRSEGSSRRDSGRPDGLAHCVGDFGWPCADGRSRILSLRRGGPTGFERVSTAEVTWNEQGPQVRQHSGRANGAPAREAEAALAAYMDHLALTGCVGPPPAGRRRRLDPRVSAAGYDATKAANVAHALALWRPMLPRSLRRERLDDFVEAARTLLAAMEGRA